MPDQEPTTPNPASGAERLSLSMETVRGAATASSPDNLLLTFADDDPAAPSHATSICGCFADDDSE